MGWLDDGMIYLDEMSKRVKNDPEKIKQLIRGFLFVPKYPKLSTMIRYSPQATHSREHSIYRPFIP